MGCHVKRADGKLADDAAEDACEASTPRSCRARYDAATGAASRIDALCPPCLGAAARGSAFDALETMLDGQLNQAIYCAPGTGPLGGDDLGNVPIPHSDDATCERTVAKAIAKAAGCIIKCHMARADGRLADDAAEEACERTDPAKSCKAKYDKATDTASRIHNHCPNCLDYVARANLFDELEPLLDARGGDVYCCPTTTTTSTTTTSTTTTTLPGPCTIQGARCGSDGLGFCEPLCEHQCALACVSSGTPSSCASDAQCPPGQVCADGGGGIYQCPDSCGRPFQTGCNALHP
jgi:hypothetical protein